MQHPPTARKSSKKLKNPKEKSSCKKTEHHRK
jgi:hypothetical protein